MRKLIVGSFVSLDGVIETPWEWIGNFFSPQMMEAAFKALQDADYFLMARKTYERFSSTWPAIKGVPYFERMNEINKLVASTTLKEATWNTKVIKGDVADHIRNLKQEPGKDIIKYGVGSLDKVLLEQGLIDEYKLSIIPIKVGKGQRIFESIDMSRIKLKLINSSAYDNGVIDASYQPEYIK